MAMAQPTSATTATRSERRRPDLTAWATVALVLINLVGLIVITKQLGQLTRQNSYLERALRQSYRPLGVATYSPDSIGMIFVDYLPAKTKDKFSFVLNPVLENHGQGVLSYLGWIGFLSTREIDFRQALLGGAIDSVRFDGMFPYARRSSLLPGQKVAITIPIEDVPFERKYFLYTLYLYEDQDGGLYDTEHLVVLPFEEPAVEGDRLRPRLEKEPGLTRERYHYYTRDERSQLADRIRQMNHPLGDFIEGE